MKLSKLEAQFLQLVPAAVGGNTLQEVSDLADADRIRFLCPLCTSRGDASHVVVIEIVRAPKQPGPRRWVASGTGLADLTLSPSIHCISPCGWHGWVVDGETKDTP